MVSSGQPSANPRLVKEAIALSEAGYNIRVLYCPLSPWVDDFDVKLFQAHPEIKWIQIGYHPHKEKIKYWYARVRQKFFQYLYLLVNDRFDVANKSQVLFSQELIKEAKRNKAELYIGHTLGAIPAVVIAAKKHQAKVAFDFEDFHRGEAEEDSLHWIKTVQTEEKYVPFLSFATTASTLITKQYTSIFPKLSITTINNCFPLSNAVTEVKALPIMPLKLFWFSQTIGEKRGLETVIEAMGKLGGGKISLSLLGNCSVKMKNYFLSIAKNNEVGHQLNFLPAVEEKEIVAIAANHHVGLACEVPIVVNRDICLTNKVFMYLLAANAVVFSNTKSQTLFVQENPGIGVVYEQNNAVKLANLLNDYINHPEVLQRQRKHSLQLAKQKLNWEEEQKKLLAIIKQNIT